MEDLPLSPIPNSESNSGFESDTPTSTVKRLDFDEEFDNIPIEKRLQFLENQILKLTRFDMLKITTKLEELSTKVEKLEDNVVWVQNYIQNKNEFPNPFEKDAKVTKLPENPNSSVEYDAANDSLFKSEIKAMNGICPSCLKTKILEKSSLNDANILYCKEC